MTAKELRSKSTEELQQELVALKDELFKLRFQHATNQLENPQRLGAVKRDIARVNTILREIELKAN
ncbi:MAG TPA: 50S ribosomal protein L29 [Clostridiales bacterium]|jgi:large subunit ribosomal protein L29|nr:50S ribosomal protein L29 [Clostridiales bacterium]MBR3032743.1 50S ribosomal protein L29 [Clostridiales bacterium]MEE3350948.1 50S ribosomal protein L29 [Saccharofermentanaceae bacterium]HBY32551.1 50S ribosomal protein L29 [Clostridiales bacterium]